MHNLQPSLELSKAKSTARDRIFQSQTSQEGAVLMSQIVTFPGNKHGVESLCRNSTRLNQFNLTP